MKVAVSPGEIIITIGIVLGNCEWVLCLLYALFNNFGDSAIQKACFVFVVA